MLRLTLAQMRRSLGRLTAAGLAIVMGTAFVAASLIAGAVITRTSYDALAASYAHADLVATGPDAGLTVADLAAMRRTPGVGAVDGIGSLSVELYSGAKRTYPIVTAVASDPRLEPQKLVSGALPADPNDVALPRPLAKRLGVGLGDTVNANRQVWTPAAPGATPDPASPDPAGTTAATPEKLTVVGLLDDPAGAFAQSGGAVVVQADDAARWAAQEAPSGSATYSEAMVALDKDTDATTAIATLETATPHGTTILTKDAKAAEKATELGGGTNQFTIIMLGFAAIALLVAGLVISNTFQVLIAQRTRALALLRCVGADKKQLRRSVILEAGLLGIAASALGLLLGIGLAQAALSVLGTMSLDVPLPAVVSLTPAVILAPLAVGTLVTLLASLAPARAATKVAPLAALRPADAPAFTHRRNLPRLVIASLLTIGGVALLVLAVVIAPSTQGLAPLGLGVLGGGLSFVGVLVGAVFWVPGVVGAIGRLLARTGTSAKLAAANTVRNPRRTAATSTALLIGVTLVTLMSTGAASARTTLAGALDSHYPFDVQVVDPAAATTAGGAGTSLVTPGLVDKIASVPGVAHVATARYLSVQLGAGQKATTSGAFVLGADDATAVLRVPSWTASLDDTTVIVSRDTATQLGIANGATVTVTGQTDAAAPAGKPIELTASVTDLPGGALLTPGALTKMAVDLPLSQVWARLADVTQSSTVVPAISDTLDDTAVQISGAGVERATFQKVIDTSLAIVVGLLAVAVLIALIGVANTLSLSVIERGRESATLRAIGLSRRQLRATLAIEGMLIAGVGAVLGAVLGTLYGWAGAATTLSMAADVQLEVPWRDLGLVVLVALVAGLLASVVPGRAAARTSPVAALGVD